MTRSLHTGPWPGTRLNGIPSPIHTEEAWRRTDIHNLPTDKFKLALKATFDDLPPVREDLLKPLIADQHGGQIVLTPGGVQN